MQNAEQKAERSARSIICSSMAVGHHGTQTLNWIHNTLQHGCQDSGGLRTHLSPDVLRLGLRPQPRSAIPRALQELVDRVNVSFSARGNRREFLSDSISTTYESSKQLHPFGTRPE